MDELRQAYIAESQELLASLEENLLGLEQNPADTDALNAVFRAAHTIKGGAGIVECDYIVEFTHVVENALDEARDGRIKLDGELIQLLLASGDQIARLLEFAIDPAARPDAATLARGEELLTSLRAYSSQAAASDLAAQTDSRLESSGGGMVGHDCWHISIRFGENVLREGMDPCPSCATCRVSVKSLISPPCSMPCRKPTRWIRKPATWVSRSISAPTPARKRSNACFDFVRDSCLLNILPPYSKVSEYVDLIMSLPEDTMRLGEILLQAGVITSVELNKGLETQGGETVEPSDASTRPRRWAKSWSSSMRCRRSWSKRRSSSKPRSATRKRRTPS
jgi:two-component system, chemotaxis family, sensor kinase CheA